MIVQDENKACHYTETELSGNFVYFIRSVLRAGRRCCKRLLQCNTTVLQVQDECLLKTGVQEQNLRSTGYATSMCFFFFFLYSHLFIRAIMGNLC